MLERVESFQLIQHYRLIRCRIKKNIRYHDLMLRHFIILILPNMHSYESNNYKKKNG